MYDSKEFDKELKKERRKYDTSKKLETVAAWRYNDRGSDTPVFATMTTIMDAYNDYRLSLI